jgi:hypothetical protein
MKKLLIGILALSSISAFAGAFEICERAAIRNEVPNASFYCRNMQSIGQAICVAAALDTSVPAAKLYCSDVIGYEYGSCVADALLNSRPDAKGRCRND